MIVAQYMAELLTVCRIESDEGTKPVYFYNPDEGIYINDREFLKRLYKYYRATAQRKKG